MQENFYIDYPADDPELLDISENNMEQSKIEFAVAQLLKFKKTLIKFLQDNDFYENEWYDLFDEIDQQIKELKGEER